MRSRQRPFTQSLQRHSGTSSRPSVRTGTSRDIAPTLTGSTTVEHKGEKANGAAGRCFVQDPTCDRGLFDGLLVDAFVSADSGSMGAILARSRHRLGVYSRRVLLRRLGPHAPWENTGAAASL